MSSEERHGDFNYSHFNQLQLKAGSIRSLFNWETCNGLYLRKVYVIKRKKVRTWLKRNRPELALFFDGEKMSSEILISLAKFQAEKNYSNRQRSCTFSQYTDQNHALNCFSEVRAKTFPVFVFCWSWLNSRRRIHKRCLSKFFKSSHYKGNTPGAKRVNCFISQT